MELLADMSPIFSTRERRVEFNDGIDELPSYLEDRTEPVGFHGAVGFFPWLLGVDLIKGLLTIGFP